MKLRQAITPIAIVSTLGLLMAGEAAAAPAAKGVSYLDAQDVVFFPDGGDGVISDNVPDCNIADPLCFILASPDVPATSSSASKAGEPDAGSSAVDPALNRGPLNVDQACVRDFPPVADNPLFTPPCPANDTFTDVPGFPANNVSRGDARVDATQGYVFPSIGTDCSGDPPADGLGVCGTPGNTLVDVRSIAESQVNVIGEQGKAESDVADTFNGVFVGNSPFHGGETALTLTFNVDWCRQAQLEDAVSSGTVTSKATGSTNANFVISIAAGQPDAGTVVFDANLAGLVVDVNGIPLNGTTELVAPVPGPVTALVSADPLGSPTDQSCFPRPGGTVPIVISSNPTGLSKAACDAQRPTCFISDPDVEYTFNVVEGTDVDVLVFPPTDGVHKWYFGKQASERPADEPLMQPAGVVTLNDQFASRDVDVRFIRGLWNPAGKNSLVDPARDDHHTCYEIVTLPGQGLQIFDVDIETDNFGEDSFRLGRPNQLCISAAKTFNGVTEGSPVGTDYLCYTARSDAEGEFTLNDQFDDEVVNVTRLSRFCTPVGKNQPAPPTDPAEFDHLACYDFNEPVLDPFITVGVDDQFTIAQGFDPLTFWAEKPERFCEPARKIAVTPRF